MVKKVKKIFYFHPLSLTSKPPLSIPPYIFSWQSQTFVKSLTILTTLLKVGVMTPFDFLTLVKLWLKNIEKWLKNVGQIKIF